MDRVADGVALKVLATLVALSIPSIIVGRVAVGAELLLALACIFFLPNIHIWRKRIELVFKDPTTLLIVLMLVTWIPGIFASVDPEKSVITWLRTGLFIIAAMALWSALKDSSRIRDHLHHVLIIGTLLLASVALLGFMGFSEIIGFIRGNGWEEYGVVRHLKESASSASLLIPLLGWIAYKARGHWRLLAIVTILELFGIIWLTGSRSAMAGVIAMLGLGAGMSVLLIRSNLYRLLLIVATVSIIASTFLWLQETRGNYPDHAMAGSFWAPPWLIDPPRQAIWQYAWNAGENNRWFGVGLNAIDKLPHAEDWNASAGVRNIPLHPHNWLVEVTIETGFVGVGAMLAVILVFMYRFTVDCWRYRDPLPLTVMAIWAAYWVSGLFNFSFWSSWWQVSFLIATIICTANQEDRDLPSPV